MKNLIRVISILTLFTSCKKIGQNDCCTQSCITYDTIAGIDTIFPIEYYPAYPGSYWEYYDTINQTTNTVTVEHEWQLYPLVISETYNNCLNTKRIKMTYMPKILDGDFVKYDSYLNGGKIIDTVSGTTYQSHNDYLINDLGITKIWTKVEQFYPTFSVLGTDYSDVYHIREYYDYTAHFGGALFTRDFYFAKNIGLVHDATQVHGATAPKFKVLTSYYINN